jgi:hypothetical protein
MTPEEEFARIVREIRASIKVLHAIQTPELPRPKVKFGDPATEELAEWSIRVYAYSIVCQFREVLDSAIFLYDASHVPAVFLCCRSLFEMAAHAYYVKKHALQHLAKKDYQPTWDFMLGINQGSRYMKEKHGDRGLPPIELVEGPHIAKVIACFDEYFRERGENVARENYSFLSEFCHPNSFAFTNHLDFTQGNENVVVKFSKPAPEICSQVLPDAWFSCMPLLLSMDELLTKVGDKTLNRTVQDFMRTVGPDAEGR